MHSRIVAGAYRQIGLEDAPVATSAQDYVALALALGRDPDRSAALRAALRARAHAELDEDNAAVRAFEAFLIEAVGAAARPPRVVTWAWKR